MKTTYPKPFVSLLVLCVAANFAVAQNDITTFFIDKINIAANDSRIEVRPNGDTVLVSDYLSRNVKNLSKQDFLKIYKGTPYFRNGWYPATLYVDGRAIKGTVAYNVLNNFVYFTVSSQMEAQPLTPKSFTVAGHEFKRYDDVYKKAYNFYYEQVASTPVVVLKEYKCKYVPLKSNEKTGYETEDGSDYEGVFEKFEKFYLVLDGKLQLLKFNKAFLGLFGSKASQVENYIKQHKLDATKHGDIQKVLAYAKDSMP